MSTLISMRPSDAIAMADKSLKQIEEHRKEILEAALNAAATKYYWAWFPFIRKRLYKSAEEALMHDANCRNAYSYAKDDVRTCLLIIKAAEYLIDANPDDPAELLVSLDDFRAIKPEDE